MIVTKFAKGADPVVIKWFVQTVCDSSGGQLIVHMHPVSVSNIMQEVFLHVTATETLMAEIAEELEIRKKHEDGTTKLFTVEEQEKFLMGDKRSINDLFTCSEKQNIVRYGLENIRIHSAKSHLPNNRNLEFYEGQSIISALRHWRIIRQVFPLHDQEKVKKLGMKWCLAPFSYTPFVETHDYFGEEIALYINFLGFYSEALLFAAVVFGAFHVFVGSELLILFSVIMVLGATVFLGLWRRKCAALAYDWGTIGLSSLNDEIRPNFKGKMALDKITGGRRPQYPRWKTNVKMYIIYLICVAPCMGVAFLIMLGSFWVEDWVRHLDSAPPLAIFIPSSIYAIVVYFLNKYYRPPANALTEWENHRTQAQFDRHRAIKIIFFEFVNSFFSLFYIAFYIQDLERLRRWLPTMMIFRVVENILTSLLIYPSVWHCYQRLECCSLKKLMFWKSTEKQPIRNYNLRIPQLEAEDPRINQAIRESTKYVYEGTYDDYLKLFIQFGYVTFFAAVDPKATYLALAYNFFEVLFYTNKLCRFYQRPLSRRVKDTGAFKAAFLILCSLSVWINCALLYQSQLQLGPFPWAITCVVLEHVLYAVRQIIRWVIPDKPEWVREGLAQSDYQSRQALKSQRMDSNQRRTENNRPEETAL